MSDIHKTLLDRVELSFLSGLQDQHSVLSRIRRQTAEGVRGFMAAAQPNGTVTTATPADFGVDDEMIVNRSPRINKSVTNTAARSDGPWVALIVITMILTVVGAIATAAYLGLLTRPAPVVVQPTPVQTQPAPTRRQGEWIEFYKP